MQTSISCLQVFTVVRPSMVNNSETLKSLNRIKPYFFYNFRVIYSAIYEFSHSENGPAANSLHQAGNEKYEDLIHGISTSLSRQ